MLQLKHLVLLDSAVAGGATRMILHDSIFPRSRGLSLLYGGIQRQMCMWCLQHRIPMNKLQLICCQSDDNDHLEDLCPHKHLIGQIDLRCDGDIDMTHTLRRLNSLGLDDLMGSHLECGFGFNPPFRQGLTAEEENMCRQLKNLMCNGTAEKFSSSAVAWLTTCFELSTLMETIVMWDMLNLTTATFQTAAFRANTLTALKLYRCNVTNAMAQCIGETCKQLQHLTVAWNGGPRYHSFTYVPDSDLLGDVGLLAIAQGCPQLQEVHVHVRCDNPTVLEAFATGCPRLVVLNTIDCTLSSAALAALCDNCAGLRVLRATWAGTAEDWAAAPQRMQHRWGPSTAPRFCIREHSTAREIARN